MTLPSSVPPSERDDSASPDESAGSAGIRPATLAAYFGMLAVAIGAFFLIRATGETLVAPAEEHLTALPSPRAPVDALKHVLLAIAVVMVASRALGALFRYVRQPPVIGEVIAGILLGPSLLGRIAPGAQAFLLPREIAPYLGVLAQVGVILFMFLVGLARILTDSGLSRTRLGTMALACAAVDDATAWCLLAFVVGIVVLNVGLDLGVISPRLFAMLVVMAVVTTLLTSPLLHALERGSGAPGRGAIPQP